MCEKRNNKFNSQVLNSEISRELLYMRYKSQCASESKENKKQRQLHIHNYIFLEDCNECVFLPSTFQRDHHIRKGLFSLFESTMISKNQKN